jgi:hypothetical protein
MEKARNDEQSSTVDFKNIGYELNPEQPGNSCFVAK